MRKPVIVAAVWLSLASSMAAWAADPAERRQTRIPAQDLGAALQMLAKQRGFQVLYRTEVVDNLRTQGAAGELTVDEALRQLLQESGLVFRHIDDSTVAVEPSRPQAGVVPDATEFDTILVTGSNIRGVQDSASPLMVIDRESIERSGYSTTHQLIASLPQNLDYSENSADGVAGRAGGISGASGVNLRGLGVESTLTLLNGRRLASGGGFGSFVDISMIPLTAIERVEVLTDGASAVYGSDAVGGVVNFILRTDFEGAETRLKTGVATEGGAREYLLGQTLGRAWADGNLLASYEYHHRDNLDVGQRRYSANAPRPTDLLPSQERHSLLLAGQQQLTGAVELFGDAAFSRRGMMSNAGTTTQTVTRSDASITQAGATLGARIELSGNWLLEAAGAHSRNETDSEEFNSGVRLLEADSLYRLWTADVRADGDVFNAPGGAAKLALGGQYRREDFASFTQVSGQQIGIDIARDVAALYAELFVPLVGLDNRRPGLQALEISLAGRYERYSNFGSAANPKLGLRWMPTRDLAVRGTYGTSFRAPSFMQLVGDTTYLPYPGYLFASGQLVPPAATLMLFGTNPALQPEESKAWTLGLDYSPAFAPGLDLKLTYFGLRYEDRIGVAASGSSFLSAFVDPSVIGGFLQLSPDPAVVEAYFASPHLMNLFGIAPQDVGAIIDNRFQNLAGTWVRGFDLSARYGVETSAGYLSFDLNASYLTDFLDRQTPGAPEVSRLNTLFRPIDLRLRGGAGWMRGGFAANVYVNYANDYMSNATGVVVPVSAWTTFDLNLAYDTGLQPRDRWFDDMRFSLNILNLLNRGPPFVSTSIRPNPSFDGNNANALGRYVSLQVAKRW